MQLIRTLLIAATIVVTLSGISIFFGSSKQEKKTAIYFLLSALGASVWTIAIAIFLEMPNTSPEFIHGVVTCIITGVTLCDVGLLAFLGWNYKGGKQLTVLFSLIGAILVGLLAFNPNFFYSSVEFEKTYTHLIVNYNWYYFSLIGFFFLISIIFSGYLKKRIKETTNRSLKRGLQVFYVGLSIGGILALIFNLVLLSSQPALVWIGPMATIISIMSFYYSVVKFRTLSISSKWMQIMSYALLVATAIIIYILAFYVVFTALFKIPNPSTEILILNLIMAVFLILLTPALVELTNFMKASFFTEKIELSYVMKKLDGLDGKKFDPVDMVKFLADTLHYENCAIVLPKYAYTNDNSIFTTDEITEVLALKPEEGTIWIEPEKNLKKDGFHISHIAVLNNSRGKEVGKVVFGKSIAERRISKKDFVKLAAVVNMVGVIVEDSPKA